MYVTHENPSEIFVFSSIFLDIFTDSKYVLFIIYK